MRQATIQEFNTIQHLIEISFPEDERRTAAEQRKVWEDPHFRCYVLDDGGQILGFMTIWQFEGWAYAEHLATNPEIRGQGAGARILQEIKTLVTGQLCLEVEHPDHEMARRRIGFYKRNGFYMNDYPYIQPAYSPGKNPVPLLIMTTDGPIDTETYEMIRDTLYHDVYKVH